MKKQFDAVDCRYGSPMGRAEWRESPTEAKSVRLFRVRLDSSGYDDGGAYWGIGKPLWCATDDANYRLFCRADSRLIAIREFRLPAWLLKKQPRGAVANLRALEAKGNIGASGVILRQKLDELGYA